MQRGRGIRGFSLVELIVVIILVGILFSLGGTMLGKVFSSYSAKKEIADADWQAKLALERAARELRAVRSATAADLDVASLAQVRFIDSDGNGVCFYHDAATNRLRRSADGPATLCGTTSPQTLAEHVTSLQFSYWAQNGAATAVVASVYYITIEIRVVEGVYDSRFRTNVRPRNF